MTPALPTTVGRALEYHREESRTDASGIHAPGDDTAHGRQPLRRSGPPGAVAGSLRGSLMAKQRHINLRAELDAGHPDTGAYNANDALAADEINDRNRPAAGDVQDMIAYIIANTSRTNEGADVVATSLAGRLARVATADVGTDPFRRGGVWEAGADDLGITLSGGNIVTFGAAHDITAFNSKDPVVLYGFGSNNDGMYRLTSVNTGTRVIVLEGTLSFTSYTFNRVAWVQLLKRNDMLEAEQKDAAVAFQELVGSNLQQVNFADTDMDSLYEAVEAAGVWKAADSSALKAFSENKISRADELNAVEATRVGVVIEGDVTVARAI